MMTIGEINNVLARCNTRYARQEKALEETRREIVAWTDLRNAKEKETKQKETRP